MNTVTLIDVENDEGNHPLRTARTMMRLLHCYARATMSATSRRRNRFPGIRRHRRRAGRRALLPLHVRPASPGGEQRLQAPWYGGMSQGAALIAYAHVYEVSGDDHYRDLADRVFRSFTNVRRTTGDVWTTVITGTQTEFADPEDDGPGPF